MGRAPCCEKNGLKKGPWTPEEDQKLIDYIHKHGYGNWRTLPKNAGLQRCGKSCRLRWTNYLRPDIKRGRFSFEEEETIIQLHSILGNKWSAIASRLPGRTDNEIKNYWNTHIRKRLLRMGIDPVTHSPRLDLLDLSSILTYSSLYASSSSSSQISIQRLLTMHPDLLKLASSLISPPQNNNNEIQNHQNNFVHQQLNNPCDVSSALPSLTQPQQLVDVNVNSNTSSNYLTDHHYCYQQQRHTCDDHQIAAAALSTSLTEDDYNNSIPHPQLSSYTNNNYYCSSDNNSHQNHLIIDPSLLSEAASTFHSNNNFSFASVMSTPSSSPTTEDERDSYGSSTNNIFKFEIPDLLDVTHFMYSQ